MPGFPSYCVGSLLIIAPSTTTRRGPRIGRRALFARLPRQAAESVRIQPVLERVLTLVEYIVFVAEFVRIQCISVPLRKSHEFRYEFQNAFLAELSEFTNSAGQFRTLVARALCGLAHQGRSGRRIETAEHGLLKYAGRKSW